MKGNQIRFSPNFCSFHLVSPLPGPAASCHWTPTLTCKRTNGIVRLFRRPSRNYKLFTNKHLSQLFFKTLVQLNGWGWWADFCHGQDLKDLPWPSRIFLPGEDSIGDAKLKQAAPYLIYLGPQFLYRFGKPYKITSTDVVWVNIKIVTRVCDLWLVTLHPPSCWELLWRLAGSPGGLTPVQQPSPSSW